MLNALLAKFPDAKRDGAGWAARCPAHDDRRASLSIGTGDDGRVLLKCHAGCSLEAITAAAHIAVRDLFPATQAATASAIVATYRYEDEGGAHLYDVVRFAPKDFRQRRADGVWKMNGVRRVLYRLRELQGQTIAYVVEGEKDADRLRAIGLPGTTGPGGAGKWREDYAKQLHAAAVEHVVVLPDADDAGRAHAGMIAQSCQAAGLLVKIVTLPDLPTKGDVSDWLDAGHTREELVAIIKQTPLYTRVAPSPGEPGGAAAVKPEPPPIEVRPVIVHLADVRPEAVRWLWLARLALGKLTLLIGDPGLGKSWITLYIAAMLSTGQRWPDGSLPPGIVSTLLLTAEDGLADTIRPRLDALGADVSRIHHLAILRAGEQERAVQLADVRMIEQAMIETDARVLIVDPVSAYVGATDSHKDAPVRGLLAPLSAMLERREAAGLAVMHLRKNSNGPAVHRTGGSIAFAAAARIVLAVAEDHERGGRRVFASVKQNLTADPSALEYSLADGRLAWATGPVENVDINVLLSGPANHAERGEQTDAEQLLHELLADESEWPMDAKTAKAAGEAHGIHERTLRRAASRMGISIRRVGFGGAGRWVWHRPTIADSVGDTLDRAMTLSPMSGMTEPATNRGHTHIEDKKNPPPRAREAGSGADGDRL